MARQTRASIEVHEAAKALKEKINEHCKQPMYRQSILRSIDDAIVMFDDASMFGVRDPSLPLG